jgi:retinol dehydrogenase-12
VRELSDLTAPNSESKPPAVIVNCMTPGACKSDFNREAEGIGAFIQSFMEAVIARSTEVGSRALVDGVAVGEESHGKYMKDCVIGRYEVSFS